MSRSRTNLNPMRRYHRSEAGRRELARQAAEQAAAAATPDLTISGSGTVYVITPLTNAGSRWLEKNVPVEDWQRFGPGIAVEHRFIEAIKDGALDDGLEVA